MIKKLLKSICNYFSYKKNTIVIENYLSCSEDTYDLDYKIRELDKLGKYNNLYS